MDQTQTIHALLAGQRLLIQQLYAVTLERYPDVREDVRYRISRILDNAYFTTPILQSAPPEEVRSMMREQVGDFFVDLEAMFAPPTAAA